MELQITTTSMDTIISIKILKCSCMLNNPINTMDTSIWVQSPAKLTFPRNTGNQRSCVNPGKKLLVRIPCGGEQTIYADTTVMETNYFSQVVCKKI